jgi:hypothetical protein
MSDGDSKSISRPRLLWGVLIGLLGLHALVAHFFPEFLGLRRIHAGPMYSGRGIPGMGMDSRQRVLDLEGRRLLWAGADPTHHFDITAFRLEAANLHYGLGREHFPALIEPRFQHTELANEWLLDEERVLLVEIGDETKVYPIGLLQRHEVVNDEVGGTPIFAAFCILADLGAVYERLIEDHTFTFGVSGYTYADPDVWDGMDAFVLWDRDSNSLWWPPIGKAVSGPMIDQPMRVLDETLWAQTTWAEAKSTHPDANVLAPGQDFTRPMEWPRYPAEGQSIPVLSSGDPAGGIPPRWGSNADF